MNADAAVCTGERRRRQSDNDAEAEQPTGDRAIQALAPVPVLDWPADLFASAIVDDDAVDGAPLADGMALIVIWPSKSARASTSLGVAP